MELSGNLKRFPVANVLQFLNMESATGTLTLKQKKDRIVITLQEGNPLAVEHSATPKNQRMGEILIESNRVSQEEFESAVEEHRNRLVPLGTALHSRGLISEDERKKLAALVYNEILLEALSWKEGTYDFMRLDKVEEGELEEPLSIQTIMLQIAQQEDEWPLIRRYVPSSESVFSPSPSESLGIEAMMASLSPEDRAIAERIDGLHTVGKIAAETLRSEFEVAKLITELSRRGLVVAIQQARDEEEDLRRRSFFSPDLGPAAILPLAAAFFIIAVFFAWRNYVSPVLSDTERALAPIIHAGRDPATVDRLRLRRLLDAFHLYRDENGALPHSFATLARLGYCSESDLFTADGGKYMLKIIGQREEKAVIAAVSPDGSPRPDLTVEIPLK